MRRPPSLAAVTAAFVILSATLVAIITYVSLNDLVRNYQEKALSVAVQTRASGAQLSFFRAIYREWLGLKTVAAQVVPETPTSMAQALNVAVGSGKVISWAGFATDDGIVQAASNGLLANMSVASRPWFQQGLEGTYAGDVHEALLLAKLLPSTNGEPRRFLDLATPIHRPNGTVAGVLGYHLNYDWARNFLIETAKSLDVDLFIVNSAGDAVIATDGGEYHSPDLPSFRTARTGVAGVSVETWPDGRSYFTAVLPEVGYEDLPRFGWSMIARIDARAVAEPDRQLSRSLLWSLGLFGLLLLLLTVTFIVLFIRPFAHLAQNASRVAAGDDVYPYESERTSELSAISSAVATLQARDSGSAST